MRILKTIFALLLIFPLGLSACRQKPSANESLSASQTAGSPDAPPATENLKILPGMKIRLSQKGMGTGEKIFFSDQGVSRTLKMENAIGAEGISFSWASDNNEGANAKDVAAKSTEGHMTLANLVGARQMTLPAFWPAGDLFLSNSSAIWLSDQAFQDLKKSHQTSWQLGLKSDSLMGEAQGFKLLEESLKGFQQGLQADEKKQQAATIFEGGKRSKAFPVKINGKDSEVEAIEAENSVARLKILDNPQNPLILQVELNPTDSVGGVLFSPLTMLKPFLEYKVEEIDLPRVGEK